MKRLMKIALVLGIITIIVTIYYSYADWKFTAPVKGSNKYSYEQKGFGAPRDGHKHKGVDIFAKSGTPVISASKGLVIYTGVLSLGGNVVLVLGPAFKTHYYAHLSSIDTHVGSFVTNGDQIGKVGNTGNAKTTPAHLHYSIGTILPKWHKDNINGLSFYTDPVPLLNKYFDEGKLVNKNS